MADYSRITIERLREALDYDPETGIFRRKISARGPNSKVGDQVGRVNCKGYREIMLDRVRILASRLAWFYMTGAWPKSFIDHINRQREDNRFANLREATPAQNQANSPVRPGSFSGQKGVVFRKFLNKWNARITINGRRKSLGYFPTAQQASIAYQKAAIEHYGDFVFIPTTD